jgi:hypothetical protein
MNGIGDHHIKKNKLVPKRQMSHVFCHLWKQGESKTKQKHQGHKSKRGTTERWKGKTKRGRSIWTREINRGINIENTLYACMEIT